MTSIGLIGAAHDNAGLVQKDQRRMLDVAWSEDCDREKRAAWDAWQAPRSGVALTDDQYSLMTRYAYKDLHAELHHRFGEVRIAVAPYDVQYRHFAGTPRALSRSIDVVQSATCGLCASDSSRSKLKSDELARLVDLERPLLMDLDVKRDRKRFETLRQTPRINAVAPYVMAFVMASRDLAAGASYLAISGYVYEQELRNYYDLAVTILTQSGDWNESRFRAFDFTLPDL